VGPTRTIILETVGITRDSLQIPSSTGSVIWIRTLRRIRFPLTSYWSRVEESHRVSATLASRACSFHRGGHAKTMWSFWCGSLTFGVDNSLIGTADKPHFAGLVLVRFSERRANEIRIGLAEASDGDPNFDGNESLAA